MLVFITGLGVSNVIAQTGVTIETNLDSFEQGQAVMITGNAEEKSVVIQVKDTTGMSILVRTVMADSDGNFELEFRIAQSAALGDYQIIASIVMDDLPIIGTTAFEVVEKSEKETQIQQTEKEKKKGGCLIATATFGSELAPQVQYLREIRDNTVLQTQSGTAFMTGFNQFYYSFSSSNS